MRPASLPFEVFLGLRYLRARGHRTNLSLFVWIGIGGVFLGVSALIVVLAVMTGFQDGIRDKIIAANPHILIMEAAGRGGAMSSMLISFFFSLFICMDHLCGAETKGKQMKVYY